MKFMRRYAASGFLLGAVGFFTGPAAHAELTKHECVQANANGQHLFVGGKLTAARAAFQSCATTDCPAVVQNDCIKRLDDVDRIQPSILFEAKDVSGSDVAAVSVTVDGVPLANRLDGTPLRVDPGEHAFVFSMAGAPPVTKTFVLAERDQSRKERIVLGTSLAAQPVPEAPPVSSQSVAPGAPPNVMSQGSNSGLTTLRTVGLISGGVGIVGIGLGAVFAVMANSALNDQNSACASQASCSNHAAALSDHSNYITYQELEVASFITGGVLLAAGAGMFLAGRRTDGMKTGLFIGPLISPQGPGLMVRGGF